MALTHARPSSRNADVALQLALQAHSSHLQSCARFLFSIFLAVTAPCGKLASVTATASFPNLSRSSPTFHVREQNPSGCWVFAHRSSLHGISRRYPRRFAANHPVTRRYAAKKFAVEANVESRVSPTSPHSSLNPTYSNEATDLFR